MWELTWDEEKCAYYFLTEKLPADSKEVADFDIQLQQSIVALQELNNDLINDTAILYSMADVPGPDETNKLAPKQIYGDIIKWGFTWWVYSIKFYHIKYCAEV